jgi:Contractile injection system tube protein
VNTSPRSPRTLKGAIVALDIFNPVASVIVFQYNPESLTRSISPQIGSEGGSRSEVLRLKGAPKETISADIMIDATDQLEKADQKATRFGIYPQLSALEMLVYPKSSLVIANTLLSLAGTLAILPPQAPLTLFSWGPARVVPVVVESMSITEDLHDVNLNPIRAKVSLGLRVLTYDDLPVTHLGYGIFLAHQVVKETFATLGSLDNLNALAQGDVRIV